MQTNSKTILPIVTFDGPHAACLSQKTAPVKKEELEEAALIAKKLIDTLSQYSPAAGLAAPQIGISKSVFIYSYDRNPANLEVVINPEISPIGEEKLEGWEACFSSLLSQNSFVAANIPRYRKIEATFLNLKGESVTKVLDGFAAKVFQHELDHLNGICNNDRKDGKVRSFTSKEALQEFMKEAHKEDQTYYIKPETI